MDVMVTARIQQNVRSDATRETVVVWVGSFFLRVCQRPLRRSRCSDNTARSISVCILAVDEIVTWLVFLLQFRCREWGQPGAEPSGWRRLSLGGTGAPKPASEARVLLVQVGLGLRDVAQVNVEELVHRQREGEAHGTTKNQQYNRLRVGNVSSRNVQQMASVSLWRHKPYYVVLMFSTRWQNAPKQSCLLGGGRRPCDVRDETAMPLGAEKRTVKDFIDFACAFRIYLEMNDTEYTDIRCVVFNRACNDTYSSPMASLVLTDS
uniref:Uncharacterized protein n=1 Tax=Timema bartmani TaxID=61472 RepID=A0A7R9FAH0_9NEOP|nr:unnamed protein product [Timema bartmani]